MTLSKTPTNISARMSHGLNTQDDLMSFAEGTLTAAVSSKQQVTLPANTNNTSVNLATLFPGISSARSISIRDISNPGRGVSFGMANGGARFPWPAGFAMMMTLTGTLPTIYFDNQNGVGIVAEIEIAVTGV